MLAQGQHTPAICVLRSHSVHGRYLHTLKNGQLRLNKAKIRESERLDGKYLIRTSDDTLEAEGVALGYKQLVDIEDAFRILEQRLVVRPVYHQLEDRIHAYIVLCWLALLLVRVAERVTSQRWRQISKDLARMIMADIVTSHGTMTQHTEITGAQKAIFTALKVREPPRVLDIRTRHTS